MFAAKRFEVIRNNIQDYVEVSPLVALINVLPNNCALLDANGVILAVNEAWKAFARCNGLRDTLFGVGQNYLETCRRAAKTEPFAAKALSGIEGVLTRGETFTMEYPCHSPVEKRWFMLTASPLEGAGPGRVLLMHTNITERVLAEHSVQAKYDELKQLTEQRAAYEKRLDEFYSMISHDIRSPLCSVVATMRLLSQNVTGSLSLTESELLGDAEMASNQVIGLITDFLDHKKINEHKGVLEFATARTNQIMGKAQAVLRGLAKQSGVELVLEGVDERVICNEDAIVRVVVNLLTNAIKFTPEGKRIYLGAFPCDSDHVEFCIRDEGVGMSQETVAKIFEPFAVSTKSGVMSGSGLGMMIVKQLLEQHDAIPIVESELGAGTKVSFRLQRAQE